jgi:hypothetical protein
MLRKIIVGYHQYILIKADDEKNMTGSQESEGKIAGFNRKLTQLKNLDQLLPLDNKFWNLALDIGPEIMDVLTASSVEFYQSCIYEGAPCNLDQYAYFSMLFYI